MTNHHPTLPPPPEPTRLIFDPFNSSTTGHQRADDNRLSGSTSWRESRTRKLAHQLGDRSGRGGRQHLSDIVKADSKQSSKYGRQGNGDRQKGAPGPRENGRQDIRDMMNGSKKRKIGVSDKADMSTVAKKDRPTELGKQSTQQRKTASTLPKADHSPNRSNSAPSVTQRLSPPSVENPTPPQIFRSLVLYINGSTGPLVSDLRLKQLWVQHGGSISIALGKRSVTHVVLGEKGHGGGGLASGKIQKEVSHVRGRTVKYVSVRWVLDCIDRGKRVSEARYGVVEEKVGGAGQRSVRKMINDTTRR